MNFFLGISYSCWLNGETFLSEKKVALEVESWKGTASIHEFFSGTPCSMYLYAEKQNYCPLGNVFSHSQHLHSPVA